MDNRYTTSGVLIVNKCVFIAQREGSFDGLWEFPGGKNRYEETLEETLKREWKEELNLDIEVKDKLLEHKFTNKNTNYTMIVFFIECNNINPKLSVHKDWKLIPLSKLNNYNMVNSDSKIREKIIEHFHLV